MLETIHRLDGSSFQVMDISNRYFIPISLIDTSKWTVDDARLLYDTIDKHIVSDIQISHMDRVLTLLHWRNNIDSGDLIIPHTINDSSVNLNVGNMKSIAAKIEQHIKFEKYIDKMGEYSVCVDINPILIGDDIVDAFIGSVIAITDYPLTSDIVELDVHIEEYIATREFIKCVNNFADKISDNTFKLVDFKGYELTLTPINVMRFALSLLSTKIDVIHDQQFAFINKLGSTYEHYMEASQRDIIALIKRTQDDIDRQNKEYEGSKASKMPSMPSMPSIPSH